MNKRIMAVESSAVTPHLQLDEYARPDARNEPTTTSFASSADELVASARFQT